MKLIFATILILICVTCFSTETAAPPKELDNMRAQIGKYTEKFKDMRASVVVTKSNRRELEKMGKAFAETYQLKEAKVSFKSPDCLRMDGTLGVMSVEFITAGTKRLVRIPSARYKKREDISDEREKWMTSLDVGVVGPTIWTVYNVTMLGVEKHENCPSAYMLKLETDKSKKSQVIWIEDGTWKLLRRDRLLDDGSIKAKTVYLGHKFVEGLWVPTKSEVYNGENKLAAVTETRDIVVNSGVTDKEFE